MTDAPDSGSLWGKMFGLGPLFEAAKNPQLIQQAMDMMQSMMLHYQATLRIEAKLDIILRGQGHDIDGLNARIAEQFGRKPGPVILEQHGADGAGRYPVATRAADDGNSGVAQPARGTGRR